MVVRVAGVRGCWAVELLLDDGSFARKARGLNMVRAPSAIANILVIRNPSYVVKHDGLFGGTSGSGRDYVGLVSIRRDKFHVSGSAPRTGQGVDYSRENAESSRKVLP